MKRRKGERIAAWKTSETRAIRKRRKRISEGRMESNDPLNWSSRSCGREVTRDRES